MTENGVCAYGKVHREKIQNVKDMLHKFITNDFKHLEVDVKSLVKNQNKRPTWFGAALVVILTNLVVGLSLAQILQAK